MSYFKKKIRDMYFSWLRNDFGREMVLLGSYKKPKSLLLRISSGDNTKQSGN